MSWRILYGEGGAVIAVSRPRGVAHGYDECFCASRGNRKTPQSRDGIIIKRYIIIIINYYCHVRVSWQALRSTRGAHNIHIYLISPYNYTSFDFHRAVNHYHDVLHFIHILQKEIYDYYYFIVISCYLYGDISLFFNRAEC